MKERPSSSNSMNFGNSTIGKTYNLQNSVNLQQLLSLKELKNETVYYWENKAGLKYLGITPLTPQEAELSQEEQNHYFKDLGGFVMLAREFEEDTTRALFFRYALFQEKQHTRLITLEPDNDKNTPDLPLMETLFDNLQNPDNDGTTKNTGGAAPLPFKLIQSEERPTRQQWQARIIAALKELGDPENLKESLEPAGRSLKKVVFKRDISFTIENFSQGKIGAPLLFHHLCQKSTSAYKIFIKTKQSSTHSFMSVTPESLFKSGPKSNELALEAIAGTRARSADPQQDLELARELLTDDKERREHQAVIDQIQAVCANYGKIERRETSVLKLKGIQHLKTPLTLKLLSDQNEGEKSSRLPKIIKLADTLHPTPAVCGTPSDKAKDFIREVEGKRGLYAGLLGVFSHHHTEASVLIRSLTFLHDKQSLIAYGGAGIVKGSNELSEWNETKNKVFSFLGELISDKKELLSQKKEINEKRSIHESHQN